ncbi:ABC transporter permease subunit [Cryobacterium sp. PH31-AA6]|uniref:ABC transporter permease n=1 Tax=Cryobacterium sp. PH31-AA6 TaxID=3046205 RepID=UPI0024B98EAA|nr:ABC transporter permease subunit [Cryobacterium sp. PH31-AA6]MDJ0322680.1 ABC transporter permease subunit [Cryobacterium sp. PH31-AA6]
MRVFLVSARHEMLTARRTHTSNLLLVVFIGMVIASSVIGWVTHQTVTDVYDKVIADGLSSAVNPFAGISPLYYARNAVIYVLLIGSLMAIVLGVQSTLRDRRAATSDLVLSRPVGSGARLLGQLAGLGMILAVAIGISMSISWVIISSITGAPLGWGDTARLVAFSALSWMLLESFALLGMLTGLRSRQETTALLVPFVIWSLVAFVLPQIGTAARPVSLLNPVPAVNPPGGYFDLVSVLTDPLSVTEQFKRASSIVLQDSTVTGDATSSVLILLAFLVLMTVVVALTPRARMRSGLNE